MAKLKSQVGRGTLERPRLSVFRSAKHINSQLVDDIRGVTLVSAASVEKDLRSQKALSKGKIGMAEKVGKILAERALAKGIQKAFFDRNGYRYHGRVKALANAARAGGLLF